MRLFRGNFLSHQSEIKWSGALDEVRTALENGELKYFNPNNYYPRVYVNLFK